MPKLGNTTLSRRTLSRHAAASQLRARNMEEAKRSWWVQSNGRKWYDRPWLPFPMKAVFFWRQRDRAASAVRQLTLKEFAMVAGRTWIGILPPDLLEHLHEEYERKRCIDHSRAMRAGSRLRLRFSEVITAEAWITERKWYILRNAPWAFWRTVQENGVYVTARFQRSMDSEWRKRDALCNAARDFGTGANSTNYLGGNYRMEYFIAWRLLHSLCEEYVSANLYRREDEAEAMPPRLSRILGAGDEQVDRILQAGKDVLLARGAPVCGECE